MQQSIAPRGMVAVLATCALTAAMMQTLVLPIIPLLPALLGTDVATASWVATSTLIVGAAASPIVGRCGDLYGRRRTMLVVLAALVCGSVVCALSMHVGLMIAGRSLQGLALGVVPLAIGMVREVLPAPAVASATARITATIGLGSGLGVPLAGLAVDALGWHALFWFSAVLAVVVAALAATMLPKDRPHPDAARFDIMGSVLLAATVTVALFGVTQGSAWGWAHVGVIGAFVAAVVLGACWVAHERSTSEPLVHPATLLSRRVLHAHISVLLLGCMMFANYMAVVQIIQLPTESGFGFGRDTFTAGLILLPAMGAMVAGSSSVPWMVRRIGALNAFAAGCTVIALAYGAMLLASSQLWEVAAWASVAQLGTGVCVASVPLLLVASVPAAEMSTTHGFNNTLRFIGSATGSAVFATLMITFASESSGMPTKTAFSAVYVIALAIAIGLIVVNLAMAAGSRGLRLAQGEGA
jgi:MFS family permease